MPLKQFLDMVYKCSQKSSWSSYIDYHCLFQGKESIGTINIEDEGETKGKYSFSSAVRTVSKTAAKITRP